MPNPPEPLFDAFDAVSSKQWKQRIQYELDGADFNQRMVWESPEGIKVKPFYHRDELEFTARPTANKPFLACQEIFVSDVEKSARRANDSVNRGARSLKFVVANDKLDVSTLISGLPNEPLTLYFDLRFLSAAFVQQLDTSLEGRNFKAFVSIDPVGHLISDGNWIGKQDDFATLEAISKSIHNLSVLSVDARLYQNAGANIVQQLACTLGHATEYFNRTKIDSPMLFQIAVGSNYFFEIAKLRAMRILVQLVAKEFEIKSDIHILATPTKRNKTLYGHHMNLTRATTECMSAILGGADAVCNQPFDAIFHKSNEFGERISRNQLLVLQDEANFGDVRSVPDGSYYIENLTHQLATQALKLFKEIEAEGGFIAKLKDGTIQRKIKESAEKEQAQFDSGREKLVGTNLFPMPSEQMKQELELYPFTKIKRRKTLFVPLVEKRLAEKAEQERLASENPSQP